METEIKKNKEYGGHNLYINDILVGWICGSLKQAEREMKRIIKEL